MAWINVTAVYENTTMQQSVINGVNGGYKISPISGYVLHANNYDAEIEEPIIDEETGLQMTDEETGEPLFEIVKVLGYTRGSATCAADYDFVANPREFYAVPADSVPADQIFGVGNNDHEVM